MPDIAGSVFMEDFHGSYVQGNLIVVLTGTQESDLEKALAELPGMFSGGAEMQAHLGKRQLLVAGQDGRRILLGEEPAGKLLSLAAQQSNEKAYLAALCVHPQYTRWGSYYVSLAGTLEEVVRLPAWAAFQPELTLLVSQGSGPQRTIHRERLPAIEPALETHARLVVIGEPGSGKTTALERQALEAARRRLGGGTARLPLFLPLANFRDFNTVFDFVQDGWRRSLGGLELESRLRDGSLLLLFDALNEMPFRDADEYRRKLDGLRRFVQEEWPNNQALFTCRSLDYSQEQTLGMAQVEIERLGDAQVQEFLRLRLEETRPGLAAQTWKRLRGSPLLAMLRNPYYLNMLAALLAGGGAWPESRAGLFSGFVNSLLGREAGRGHPGWPGAPALKAALAGLAAGMQPKGEGTRLALADALEALPETVTVDGREAPLERRQVIRLGLAASLLEHPPGQADEIKFYHHQLQEYFAARELLRRFRAGEALDESWRQPTSAAEMPDPGELKPFEPLPLPPATGWEEPTALAAGLAFDPELRVDGAAFLRAVLAANPVLAGRCLGEAGLPESEALRQLKAQAQAALLAQMGAGEVHLRARLAAGLALGRLGDPRFTEAQVDSQRALLPPLVFLPGGQARAGTPAWEALRLALGGQLKRDELPAHAVQIAPLWIGRYPVTNAEFACFWQAGGYRADEYWQTPAARAWRLGEGGGEVYEWWMQVWQAGHAKPAETLAMLRRAGAIAEQLAAFEQVFGMEEEQARQLFSKSSIERERDRPALWQDGRFNNPSQPVVGVTWFEARAYCAWLSRRLAGLARDDPRALAAWAGGDARLAQAVQAGALQARLPAEAEWEYAANGGAGRRYPWGGRFDPGRANTSESRLWRTTPVGVYPAGASAQGAHDLAGNAWEWCASLYRGYPARPGDGREDPQAAGDRVVRGGSWFNSQRLARCAVRLRDLPAYFNSSLGFRLVLSLAPSGF